MFREISYTSMVMSFASFGTEIIYRAKLADEETDTFYFVQSDLVVTLTIIQTLVSLYILRTLHKLSVTRMRLLNVFVDILLAAAIGLRAKYEFFKPLDSIKYSLYNITSFFLCIQAFTFALFWFYKGPYQEQEDTYSFRPPRRSRRHHNSSTPTVHRYDEEIDYTLPSYSEVPAPPAYTKTVGPNDEVTEDAETSSNSQHEDSAQPGTTPRVGTDHVAIEMNTFSPTEHEISNTQVITTENEVIPDNIQMTEHGAISANGEAATDTAASELTSATENTETTENTGITESKEEIEDTKTIQHNSSKKDNSGIENSFDSESAATRVNQSEESSASA